MKNRCIYSNHIPSILGRIRAVVDDLLNCLQSDCGDICDEIMFDLKVILNEVLVNAIMHGNHGDADKTVKIDAGVTGNDDVFIMIEDEGCGYDFQEICRKHKSSSADPGDMIESGRGMMIIKGLCDKVEVNKKGNKIVIIKKIEKAHPVIKHI